MEKLYSQQKQDLTQIIKAHLMVKFSLKKTEKNN